MTVLGRALAFCARHGRWGLVAGLAVGLAFPALAQALRPWLPQMVAGLLFITAFRIGYRGSVGQMSAVPRTLVEVLVLQLAMPLLALGVVWGLGLTENTAALAIVLMLSAPSISGSPNFTILLGRDPAPAMQVLVVGTALFPLTALPVVLAFGLGSPATSSWLVAVILGATATGFGARAVLLPRATLAQTQALDGVGVIALAVIVVGLMAGIGPLMNSAPWHLLGWLALVFVANFGLQAVAHAALHHRAAERAIPLSIIAGNRNVALFVLALPPDVVDRLLPFIGCYQLPMYLTPLLMGRLYRQR